MKLFDFSSLRDLVKSASEKKRDLDTRINELQRKRDALAGTPASRADVKAFLEVRIKSAAQRYESRLRGALTPLVTLGARLNIHDQGQHGVSPTLGRGGDLDVQGLDDVLCGLYEAQVRKTIFEAIDRMDWPANAMEATQRKEQLARLDEQLDRLMIEREELVRTANEAGVSLD